MSRQAFTIEELRAMLTARADEVAERYAPPAPGSYRDRGQYFTLNPWRGDRSVGSFVVNVGGPRQGTWHDFASKEHGDLIDLIRLALNTDMAGALREVRAFLGLQHMSPEDEARRRAQAEEGRRRAEARRREAEAEAIRRARQARAIWLGARDAGPTCPVGLYLAGRDIDMRALPRWPNALRYDPACYWSETDPETGEVREARLPAMVAAVTREGQTVAVHRTYLAQRGGRWAKAAVPRVKKVLGDFRGGAIRIWAGIGPRGGHPVPLAQAPGGQCVHIAEGIEKALLFALINPQARILSAISLSNFGQVELPPNVGRVVLIGDRDDNPEARAALDRAVQMHAAAGREVALWQPPHPHKDINDYWGALLTEGRAQHRQEGAA